MNILTVSGFDLYVPEDSIKATLLTSLLSVWVLIGLFFYLNLYTRRRYFTIWGTAWLFYALWLTLNMSVQHMDESPLVLMFKQWCISVSAVFLLWGSARFLGQRMPQTLFGLFMVFLFIWSYIGAFHLDDRLQIQLPIFAVIGLASIHSAGCFYRYRQVRRYIGATLMSIGLVLWGVYLATFPLFQLLDGLSSTGYFVSAVLQLFIAVSMIILVLEEVRSNNQLAVQQIQSHKSEKQALRSKVISTEERYRSLFDQASEGIIIAAAEDLKILELNKTAERLLGLSRAEAPEHTLSSFCQCDAETDAPANAAEWISYFCEHRQITLVRKNGGMLPAEVDGAPIDFEGVRAYQFFFRELTDRLRLEQQLRQAEKLSALGQMISGVAHELNNPLAVIKGYLELIVAHHHLSPQTRADLEKVVHESNRAAKLVGNFLAFAREQPSHRRSLNVNEMIERMAELRKFDILVAGVELTLDLDSNVPVTFADADQIQQVIVNLVNNSVQAMVDRPPQRLLRVRTSCRENLISIRVEDNGPGVPQHLETKIFEPFFTTKAVGAGTGLGLSIAHSILSDHHGRLYYQRSDLGGAGFMIELPVVAECAQEETATELDPPNPVPLFSKARAAHVLVLDDEKSIAELLCEMLFMLGHKPSLCLAAPQALGLIEKQHFDLIISDFRMPLMNGQEFHEQVKQKNPALARRIIFLTGDVVHEQTQSFLKSSGNPHLAKPFHLSGIERVIADVLSNCEDAEVIQQA
jgi:PAS domain S-box-containing protein